MNIDKLLKLLVAVALTAFAAGPGAKKPAKPAPAPKAPRVVELTVTADGFEPGNVTVKKGEPIRLHVTRTTDETCATELVLPDYEIDQKLPLNTAVDIDFTPTKTGKLRYGCAMGMMISGVITVE
jgi:plastocyanin domain-containing protein